MSDSAKVLMAGRSQAVRLPAKYRLDADEVEISRDGEALLIRGTHDVINLLPPAGPRARWLSVGADIEALYDRQIVNCGMCPPN